MSNEAREKCGVFAATSSELNVGPIIVRGLESLQHRGQQSTGAVVRDGSRIHVIKDSGLVKDVFTEDRILELNGSIGVGHDRYATSAGIDVKHCQPVTYDPELFLAHNGNIPLTEKMESFLQENGFSSSEVTGLSDSEMMTLSIGHYMRSEGLCLGDAIKRANPLFREGSYSIVAMSGNQLVAFRDEWGIRPLCIGKIEGGYVVASETCALDEVGASYLRDVEPGELVTIYNDHLESERILPPKPKIDMFELIYFERPDSLFRGRPLFEIRYDSGRMLAWEDRYSGVKADMVIPVPDSGIPGALGYADQSGIPFELGLIKNPNSKRSFIESDQEARAREVRDKLSVRREIVAGRDIIVIDDSVVRGTTTPPMVELLRDAGANSVHLRIVSPPVTWPDMLGVATKKHELIAARKTHDEIVKKFGVDSLRHISLRGLLYAFQVPGNPFSTHSFTGDYPCDVGIIEEVPQLQEALT